MALIDSGWRLRFKLETVRRFKPLSSWGLLRKGPRELTERSSQFFRVREARRGGQGKDEIVDGENVPLTCSRWSLGGQFAVGVVRDV